MGRRSGPDLTGLLDGVELNAWSLDRGGLAVLVDCIQEHPGEIVECGSGASTVVMARLLRELDSGRLTSLEHEPAWAAQVRDTLAADGSTRASVITAPLEPHALAGGIGWYARAALAELPEEVELLFIDGPPAGDADLQRSRHPALAEFGPRLAPGATILLDDADRPGEAAAIELWEREYELRFARQPGSRLAKARWHL